MIGRVGVRIWPVIAIACARTVPPAEPLEEPVVVARPPDVASAATTNLPTELPPDLGETRGLAGYVTGLWDVPGGGSAGPHLDIAAAFGVAGDWRTQCSARGDPPRPRDRDEVLGDLLAWCAIDGGDPARGIAMLAALAEARSLRVARAAAADVVAVLAEVPGGDALEILRRTHLASRENLWALADGYLALGRLVDAAAAN